VIDMCNNKWTGSETAKLYLFALLYITVNK